MGLNYTTKTISGVSSSPLNVTSVSIVKKGKDYVVVRIEGKVHIASKVIIEETQSAGSWWEIPEHKLITSPIQATKQLWSKSFTGASSFVAVVTVPLSPMTGTYYYTTKTGKDNIPTTIMTHVIPLPPYYVHLRIRVHTKTWRHKVYSGGTGGVTGTTGTRKTTLGEVLPNPYIHHGTYTGPTVLEVASITVHLPGTSVDITWKPKPSGGATGTVVYKNADRITMTIWKETSKTMEKYAQQTFPPGSGTKNFEIKSAGVYHVVVTAIGYLAYYTRGGKYIGPKSWPGMAVSVTKTIYAIEENKCEVSLPATTVKYNTTLNVNVKYTGFSKVKITMVLKKNGVAVLPPTTYTLTGVLTYITPNGLKWYTVGTSLSLHGVKPGEYELDITLQGYDKDKGTWVKCCSKTYTITIVQHVSASIVTAWHVSVPQSVQANQQAKAKVTVDWNIAESYVTNFKATVIINGKQYSASAKAYKSPFVFEVPFKAPSKPGEYHATVKLYVGGGSMGYQSVGSKTVSIEVVSPTLVWSVSVNPNKVTPGGSVTITANISNGLIPGSQYRLLIKAFGKTFASQPKTFNSNSGTISTKITVPSDVSPGSYNIVVSVQIYSSWKISPS